MKQELLMEIADKIRTPAYVFSKEEFCHKAMKCRSEAAGRFRLCFSVKANPFLTDPYFEPETLFHSFEACSPPGSLRSASQTGYRPKGSCIPESIKRKPK